MKDIFVGKFILGEHLCKLYADPRANYGRCIFPVENQPYMIMKVGIKSDDWGVLLSSLIHESLEFSLCNLRLSFEPSTGYSFNSNDKLFVFDHSQFAECTERCGHFVSQAIKPLHDVWKKNRSKK